MTNKEFALWVYEAAKNVSDIDPVFIAAQAALESGWGKSGIGNNLFGITKGSWTGPTKLVLTTEYFSRPNIAFKSPESVVSVSKVNEKCYKYKVYRLFRVYGSLEECLTDHLAILRKPHFADAWAFRNDPEEYVKRLVDNIGGKYATATNYVPVMHSIINKIRGFVS